MEARGKSTLLLRGYIRTWMFYSSIWVACEYDATKKPSVFVHQTVRYWANTDADRLLMLAVKYESKGGKYRKVPDSKEQNVYLVEYKEGNLGATILQLGLVCDVT